MQAVSFFSKRSTQQCVVDNLTLYRGGEGRRRRRECRFLSTHKPLSPAVQRLLAINDLNETQIRASVKASGPRGHLLKGDILQYLTSSKNSIRENDTLFVEQEKRKEESTTSSSSSSRKRKGSPFVEKPLSNMRKIIASRLLESKQNVPHAYLTGHCSLDQLLAVRKTLNQNNKTQVSLNDFIVKAVGIALSRVPQMNVTWNDQLGHSVQHDTPEVSIAVAIPDGLITPIVKSPHHKGLVTISQEIKALAALAKQNKLLPEQFQGGTFTVSNLGMFGIKEFKAVINPPQAAILAVSGSNPSTLSAPASNRILSDQEEFCYDQHAYDQFGDDFQQCADIQPHNKMQFTLSYDIRAVPEPICAQFLNQLTSLLNNPHSMLL
mmetsp:Transcript_17904/g.26660  ORF Transcript_17904/g.26660 Transcript_17904/m.26660 type:complete len:379 (-) Transcript_17904:23-1159(-)